MYTARATGCIRSQTYGVHKHRAPESNSLRRRHFNTISLPDSIPSPLIIPRTVNTYHSRQHHSYYMSISASACIAGSCNQAAHTEHRRTRKVTYLSLHPTPATSQRWVSACSRADLLCARTRRRRGHVRSRRRTRLCSRTLPLLGRGRCRSLGRRGLCGLGFVSWWFGLDFELNFGECPGDEGCASRYWDGGLCRDSMRPSSSKSALNYKKVMEKGTDIVDRA